MNKSTNIPYNMNFTFDKKLHEVPINMDEMKKGIIKALFRNGLSYGETSQSCEGPVY